MSPHSRSLLQIHFCVVLWGFTAILGKLITLPAATLVWWRMALVVGALLLVRQFWTGLRGMAPRLLWTYAGIGVLVAMHWLTFYGSVKLSNASVAATCMALTPVFVAFVEPWIARRSFDARELLFGIAVIPGVLLVVGGTPGEMRLGIAIGALSALLVAMFGSLNKRFIGESDALSVTGIEMGAGVIVMTLVVPLMVPASEWMRLPQDLDAIYLVVLALGCTLLPFALSLVALRHLSAFTTALAVNMEPVYAIVLAVVLLGEQRELDPAFYIGVAIIMIVVFSHPLLMRRRSPAAIDAPLTDGVAGAGQPGRGTSG
ncbi:DMT family transporter [Povalibacter sp.]|uniref:DMT family transporter n=1 Tax=Povalibacter sp. TaxID=1962978 RepID=UPI002F428DB6